VRQQLVINNDFAPTIADLAGASIPTFVDGRSFAPLLTNSPPSSWRTAFLEEESIWHPHKGVHTQRYTFTEYATGEHELYDLGADPYQLQSKTQADNPQLYSALQTRLNALRACSGEGCRSAEGFPDTTPPKVMSTITDTIFKLVTLNSDGSTTRVTATVRYDAATKKAILNPSSNLSSGQTYRATLTPGAQDLAGNALDQNPNIANNQPKNWKFTVL
jgi:hypothetical protein